jgi:phosphonate transport system substrate-binding protein
MLWLPGWVVAADEPRPLELGVLPTLSTRAVFDTYEPLRAYLEERLRRPVALVTARDYRTYIERTQRGEYRFLVTAPHFARLAQTEAGYVPMVRVKRELHAIIVTRADGAVRGLNDLRHQVVTSPESLAIVTILGTRLLRQHGLVPGRNLTVQPLASFSSAVLAVHNGEAAAAITAPTALAQMSETLQANLRVIGTSPPVPPVVYIAHPRVPPEEIDRMTRVLLEFSADAQRGSAFFRKTGFVGLVRPGPDELRSLDPYVAELKSRLRAP